MTNWKHFILILLFRSLQVVFYLLMSILFFLYLVNNQASVRCKWCIFWSIAVFLKTNLNWTFSGPSYLEFPLKKLVTLASFHADPYCAKTSDRLTGYRDDLCNDDSVVILWRFSVIMISVRWFCNTELLPLQS